ncbi:hypothetical protein PGTUg99_031971 [Puccinia graminis f. sp. tritici]|uniref:Uncharacterized protein n=1 Tax=Puccinia graminis f. sp. tritici TaxID=56615 RepID=A0A5B0SEJ1_PUCGR|nr:hypothetical protein PGTUg99_031971 [Puccinia graminis f. sp. tritici]
MSRVLNPGVWERGKTLNPELRDNALTTSTEIEPPFRSTAVTRQANNAKPSHRRPPGAHLHSLDPVDTVPG